MDFIKGKNLNLFLNLFGTLAVVFLIVALPIHFYLQFKTRPASQSKIVKTCSDDLELSRAILRDLIIKESEQARLWKPSSTLLQHWLFVQNLKWNNNNWELLASSANDQLLNLYKLSSQQIVASLNKLHPPNLLTKEVQIYEVTLENTKFLVLSIVDQNALHTVLLPPGPIENILNTNSTCKKAILKTNGEFLFTTLNKNISNDLLVELQSSSNLVLGTPFEINLLPQNKKFLLQNMLDNILLVSEITSLNEPILARLQSVITNHFILSFVFLIWGSWLLTNLISQKQLSILSTIHEMSLGIFKPFLKSMQDPLFQSIQAEITSFSNHHLNRIRTFSKQIKTHHLKQTEFVYSLQKQPHKLFDSIILQIEIKNLEAVIYDYKYHNDLKELNSIWSNICEMLEDRGAVIDDLSGGTIRAYWPSDEIKKEHVAMVAKLLFEIQELAASINEHRKTSNSAPYKLTLALHIDELVVTQLGPIERKEFTALGPGINKLHEMSQIANSQQAPTVVSQVVFEYLNQNYIFSVLNTDSNERLYAIHLHEENKT